MTSHNFAQERSGSRSMVSRRLLFRCPMGNEKCAECSDRDHYDCNSGFGLEPKYRPRRVNLAMTDVSSSDFDYHRDCREDTETQDPPKCQLPTEGYFDIPE